MIFHSIIGAPISIPNPKNKLIIDITKQAKDVQYRFVVSATIPAVNKNRNPSIIIK
jgi:hypothetical protein